jgi:hypothetical protein
MHRRLLQKAAAAAASADVALEHVTSPRESAERPVRRRMLTCVARDSSFSVDFSDTHRGCDSTRYVKNRTLHGASSTAPIAIRRPSVKRLAATNRQFVLLASIDVRRNDELRSKLCLECVTGSLPCSRRCTRSRRRKGRKRTPPIEWMLSGSTGTAAEELGELRI